jgi:hypothetical protein
VGSLLMLNQDKQIGGEPIHIRDCYVWAEIYYLDSATDYREYLPQSPVNPGTVPIGDLTMLDSSSSNPWVRWALLGPFLFLSGLLLYYLL